MPNSELDQEPPKKSRFKQLFKRNKKNANESALPDESPVTADDSTLGVSASANTTPETPARGSDSGNEGVDSLGQPAQAHETLFAGDNTITEDAEVDAGLSKSRTGLLAKIGHVFKGNFNLDDDLFEDLEDALVSSDVGIEASLELVEALRELIIKEKLLTAAEVRDGLVRVVARSLLPAQRNWAVDSQPIKKPYVILMVGVNGVGKTTTTAKIARHFKDQGKQVMLAAADTFRAAAVEQLQNWGQKLDIPVIAQGHGADAAAVSHDAYTSALAKDVDVLMIDTAGRLHTQDDLMEQLHKVQRVLRKMNPDAPHEVMQILDAGTGQNALIQLEAFHKAVGVSSVCMTKLDGSAKGGMALAITSKLQLPIRFIGVGERYSDLKPFKALAFADALIPTIDELTG